MDPLRFSKKPVLGIIRGIKPGSIDVLSEVMVRAGLETVEVAMNTKGAVEMISHMKKQYGKYLSVGAGTVLSIEDLFSALNAGAEFIVMPVLVKEIAYECVNSNIPFFPGAFTPLEVFQAWETGATMVKVFPASLGGPKHIKNLKGPLDKVKLMAVGGITSMNVPEYITAGADAVAFGASIIRQELIDKAKIDDIEKNISKIIKETVLNIPK